METSIRPYEPRAILPHIVATILLCLAIPWDGPSGFFSILRWVVCAAFALLAIEAYRLKDERWAWIWGVLAGIYNPVVPVNASRDLWAAMDLVAIALVLFDLIWRHESLIGFRKFTKSLCILLVHTIIRLILTIAIVVLLFFVADFVITRWA
jgi:hypothetical protein